MFLREGKFYVRRRVPSDIGNGFGRTEIWRSLQTDSLKIALRRFPLVASKIEAIIARARFEAGINVDAMLLEVSIECAGPVQPNPIVPKSVGAYATINNAEAKQALNPPLSTVTFAEAYERYINDPTNSWSPRTRETYETCRRVAVSTIGEHTLIGDLSRSHIRDFIEVLRFLPRNAAKKFPKLSAREVSALMRVEDSPSLISAANANAYMNSLSSFLNWSVNEELLHRNPARGLRLPDETAKRDKRHPFSVDQLKAIFDAPLYRGCLNGERGYAIPGQVRPQNARYWVPLIAVHTGMRLNEICQLDVVDIERIEGVPCISVCSASLVGSIDKRLKTSASRRVVPIHRALLDLGFLAYVVNRRSNGTHFKGLSACKRGPLSARR